MFGGILFVLVVMETKISYQQECKRDIDSQTDYALTGTQYRTFTAQHYPECLLTCKNDVKCMSLNFYLQTNKCELNSQTNETRPDIYKQVEGCIYSTNIAYREPGPMKGSEQNPSKSCLDVTNSGESRGTGAYWLDPESNGEKIEALCDMETDGGGWTVVKNTILQSTTPPYQEKLDTYDKLLAAGYKKFRKNVAPQSSAMLELLNKTGFRQMHFYCHKKSVGRVFNIMTKNNTAGQQVVRYFTDDTIPAANEFPAACGSFERLPEDASLLGQNCNDWGYKDGATRINKWGTSKKTGRFRLATMPVVMETTDGLYGFGSGFYPTGNFFCDDSYETPGPCNINDTWRIAVR